MAAGCQLLFVCTFIGGIIVRLYEDIATDSSGSEALAYRFLGLRTAEDAVVIMICVAFAMLFLLGLTLFGESYMSLVQKRLEDKFSVCTMDPPQMLRGWRTRGIYACFLSHYKMGKPAASRAGSSAHPMHAWYSTRRKQLLSHTQFGAAAVYTAEAASDARYMHDMLRKMLKAPVFLGTRVRARSVPPQN
eukprot:6107983-Prymnesium_polylepis.1